jgi:pimeloyl-ACP methyl ester carboxylesterase
LDGIRFVYFVVGKGPLLVVQCPGWGIGSEYLRNGLAPLANRFTLLFYDTRLSGESGRPQDPGSIRLVQFAEDLEHLRQYWRLDRMRLLGHSWGGGIALSYALRHQEHLSALVLVDSSIPGFDYDSIRSVLHEQWVATGKDTRFADAMRSLEADVPVHTDQEFKDKLHRELPYYFFDPVTGPQKFWKTYHGTPSAWTWNAWQANFDKEQETLRSGAPIGNIHRPTLIVFGREDRLCPAVMGEILHKAIEHSSLSVLDDVGHLPWIEAPEKFFGPVGEFLLSASSKAHRGPTE